MKEETKKKIITIRFDSEEDLREFAKRVDQLNITNKTKRIVFPKVDKTQASLFD